MKLPNLKTKSPGSLPRGNFCSNGQHRPRTTRLMPMMIRVFAMYRPVESDMGSSLCLIHYILPSFEQEPSKDLTPWGSSCVKLGVANSGPIFPQAVIFCACKEKQVRAISTSIFFWLNYFVNREAIILQQIKIKLNWPVNICDR